MLQRSKLFRIVLNTTWARKGEFTFPDLPEACRSRLINPCGIALQALAAIALDRRALSGPCKRVVSSPGSSGGGGKRSPRESAAGGGPVTSSSNGQRIACGYGSRKRDRFSVAALTRGRPMPISMDRLVHGSSWAEGGSEYLRASARDGVAAFARSFLREWRLTSSRGSWADQYREDAPGRRADARPHFRDDRPAAAPAGAADL